MKFLHEHNLSEAAADLVRFDADSIRQVASAQKCAMPDIWLADADAYEKNGRVLRDSESPRLLAYSTRDRMLYATDGCNACSRSLAVELEQFASAELQGFAEENGLRLELLQRLAGLIGNTESDPLTGSS
jgi:hypothetical protein